MKRHMKRHEVPKTWPIPRKGTTFVIANNSKGLPLLIALRDILKIAQNRKEVKLAIHDKNILISNKPVVDDKVSMELFDTLSIIPSKKNYRLVLTEKGKYSLEEIDEKELKIKVTKIIGKKSLANKKIQLNMYDGRNYYFESECKVNDSAVLDLDKNKVSKILPLKEKSNVIIIGGKHAGAQGKITKMVSEFKMAEIENKSEKFNVLIKHLMVLD